MCISRFRVYVVRAQPVLPKAGCEQTVASKLHSLLATARPARRQARFDPAAPNVIALAVVRAHMSGSAAHARSLTSTTP
eukprot:scaffold19547_cov66-Phaeocystis_antarctica.AAC.2